MNQYNVFQYVVFYQHPSSTDDSSNKPRILKDVTTTVAKSEDLVRMQAVRELSEEWADKLEYITIVVHPF